MYVLTENDKKCLTHIPFYNMMIEQKQDFTGIILILNQLVRNNFSFSLGVAVFLMKGINKSERYESALAYMMVVITLHRLSTDIWQLKILTRDRDWSGF